jgi:hypothetical protein
MSFDLYAFDRDDLPDDEQALGELIEVMHVGAVLSRRASVLWLLNLSAGIPGWTTTQMIRRGQAGLCSIQLLAVPVSV